MPKVVITAPRFSFQAIITATPVLVVLMTLQANVPSLIFIRGQGYRPPERVLNVTTGTGSLLGSLLGPTAISIPVLLTPLTAGPDAGPKNSRHWAVYITGAAAVLIALLAGVAAELPLAIPLPLLQTLATRSRALIEIRVGFRFERLGDHIENIRPAAPTLDAKQLLELIRLRLQAVRRLPDGVEEVVLVARETGATSKQLELFARKPKRDPAAAGRALARVRADLGDDAVVRARLREGHLPEGSFSWESLDALTDAVPREVDTGKLVRRIHARPIPLPPRPRQEPDGWMLRGLQQGPVVRVTGPYVISGGWWNRPLHREYHFAETKKGELLWVYYDRSRRRWFLQGRVE